MNTLKSNTQFYTKSPLGKQIESQWAAVMPLASIYLFIFHKLEVIDNLSNHLSSPIKPLAEQLYATESACILMGISKSTFGIFHIKTKNNMKINSSCSQLD